MVKSVWKSAGSFFKKLKVELPYDPVIPLLCIYKKEKKKKTWKHLSKRYLHSHVYYSITHNSREVQKSKCSVMDEQIDNCTHI